MNRQSANFLFANEIELERVAPGISRQIMGYDDSILLARASFETGSVGYVHAHPHSQVTYVESGMFDFTINDETRRLATGDCVYIQPDALHGTVCIEAGSLLDIFSPVREDFLEHRKA
jgi:quercetin dioxygenase-like cupin family protein